MVVRDKPMDIVEEFYRVVREHTDTPEVFIRASAYFLISSTLGRFFTSHNINSTRDTGFRPNVWFILSSIPGATRRSTLIKFVMVTYFGVLEKFLSHVLPENIEIEEGVFTTNHSERIREIRKMMRDRIIEDGTPEGMLDHINATNFDSYSLMSPEFGHVLSNMTNKEHQKGVSGLLSKMYYGEGGSFLLSQRNKEKSSRRYLPEDLYVTMLCCLQEPKYFLNPIHLREGLLRRIIFIYYKIKDMKMDDYQDPISDKKLHFREEMTPIINELFQRMVKYNRIIPETEGNIQEFIEILLPKPVVDTVNDYARKHFKYLKENENDLGIFQQTFWEHLTKISMLNAISRDNMKGKEMGVFRVDIDKALKFLDSATYYSEDIISSLSNLDLPIQNASAPIERVYNAILKTGNTGISRGELLRRTHMISDELVRLVKTLVQSERVEIYDVLGTGGRGKQMYKIKR